MLGWKQHQPNLRRFVHGGSLKRNHPTFHPSYSRTIHPPYGRKAEPPYISTFHPSYSRTIHPPYGRHECVGLRKDATYVTPLEKVRSKIKLDHSDHGGLLARIRLTALE